MYRYDQMAQNLTPCVKTLTCNKGTMLLISQYLYIPCVIIKGEETTSFGNVTHQMRRKRTQRLTYISDLVIFTGTWK